MASLDYTLNLDMEKKQVYRKTEATVGQEEQVKALSKDLKTACQDLRLTAHELNETKAKLKVVKTDHEDLRLKYNEVGDTLFATCNTLDATRKNLEAVKADAGAMRFKAIQLEEQIRSLLLDKKDFEKVVSDLILDFHKLHTHVHIVMDKKIKDAKDDKKSK